MLTILLIALVLAIALPLLGVAIDMRIIAAALLVILVLYLAGGLGAVHL